MGQLAIQRPPVTRLGRKLDRSAGDLPYPVGLAEVQSRVATAEQHGAGQLITVLLLGEVQARLRQLSAAARVTLPCRAAAQRQAPSAPAMNRTFTRRAPEFDAMVT